MSFQRNDEAQENGENTRALLEGEETEVEESPVDRRGDYVAAEVFQGRARRGFSIPSTHGEILHVKSRWPPDSWQVRALDFINSDGVQKALVGLLLLDVLVIFVELLLDAFFPYCSHIVRDAVSCCPSDGHGGPHPLLFLGGGGDAHGDICAPPLVETDYQAGCDGHKHHGVHVAHAALFWTTVAILGTFEIELLLLIYLLGPRKFFGEVMYALDLFVVTASLILELAFHFKKQDLEVIPGILILFRSWRFVRIGHGLVASTYETMAHKLHSAVKHIEMLEERLKILDDDVPKRPKNLMIGHSSH